MRKERRLESGGIFRSGPKAGTPKWKAEQMLHALILNETGVPAKAATSTASDSATFPLVCRRAVHSDAARGMESGV